MNCDTIIQINKDHNIQDEINNYDIKPTYDIHNPTGYCIKLNISYYKGNISIPAGASFSITSEKGCVIDGDNKDRCITSIGATYLSLNNLTLINGVATSKATYKTKNNTYLSEDAFNPTTKYNGGGCCIIGSTITTIRNINFKGCNAKGCGGGLYYDPCYNILSMNHYVFPMAQYIMYDNTNIYLPETLSTNFDFQYKASDSSTIVLKSGNNMWYQGTQLISSLLDQYACIPNVKEDSIYVHGYINNGTTESIQTNISNFNRRGYQFYLENDTCNIKSNIYVSNNKAGADGGGMYINNVSYYINGSGMVVDDNTSNGHGGGICIENTVGSMYNNNFDNGIILFKDSINMIINNINFNNNKATVYGGGMYYSDNYNTIIENCYFKGNMTYGAGGGLFVAGNQQVLFNKDYTDYNSFHTTSTIKFKGEDYYNSDKGYHNINHDRYIKNIYNNTWGEYKGTFDKADDYYAPSTMNVFNSEIDEIPNYNGWIFKGNNEKRTTIIPDTKWNLNIKLNNIYVSNNNTIKSSNFDNRYFRETNNISILDIFDLPLLTGGGICIFSANQLSIKNTIIEHNKSDLYGGGLAIFNNMNNIDSLALNISNNTSSLHKGNNYLFVGDHSFYSNVNLSNGITKAEIMNQSDIFYSDIVYIYSDKGLKGLDVIYYNGFDNIKSNITPFVKHKFNNFISLYRDFYEIAKGHEVHIKGNGSNNLTLAQSIIKKLNSRSIINNKANSRFIDINNFNIFGCNNLVISGEDVSGDNNNTPTNIQEVSGAGIRTIDVTYVILNKLIINNCKATYGGAIANFTKSETGIFWISGCTFNNCFAHNLGGAVFNYIYENNKGYDNYEYTDTNYVLIDIDDSKFNNCSSKNRGGAVFAYYNSQVLIISSDFKGCTSKYGDDCYISDQSILNNHCNKCKIFVEGSSNKVDLKGIITKGLVYIDDTKTDIFSYTDGSYTKGIDKFYSTMDSNNIENIKPEILGKDTILYQLYDYDYIKNNALKNDVIVMKGYNNTNLLFNSRIVNRYTHVYDNFTFDQTSVKGIEQKYRNALFNNGDHKISFSNIKLLDIERINIKSMKNSFINIDSVPNINISNFIGNNCIIPLNGAVINIKGSNCDINLKSYIEFISNEANSGNGGAMYAHLTGNSLFNIGEEADKNSIIVANNSAINGGAFYIESTTGGSHTISTSSNSSKLNFIEYNTAIYGGGIYLNNIDAGISNININNNYANEGAGIYLGGSSHLNIENIDIHDNEFSNKSKGDFYYKNQALGGGIFISPQSYLTINNGVSIKGNHMYWGGGIFNDINPDKACRIKIVGNDFVMDNNSNYNIYIVGNIDNVKESIEYGSIITNNIINTIIESIDIGITFSNNTNGRFFTYPIKGNPSNDNHDRQLDYLFNDYINNLLVKYKNTGQYSTKSSVKSLDIKIYSDTFTYESDNIYNSKGGTLEYININGKLADFGKTKFESSNTSQINKFNDLQFKFSNLSKGLTIQHLYFNSFFEQSSSLYELSNVDTFVYNDNYHQSIYGYDTTNFKIKDIKSANIKSEFDTCYYVARKTSDNLTPNTKGGFIYVNAGSIVNSNIYLNSVLKSVGSFCYDNTFTIQTDYKNYNLPYGGVCYIYNSNLYINEATTFDGKGSIAYDGGFIYKDIDDSKIIDFKDISINNYNSYNNGGAISLNRTKEIPNTYSLLYFDTVHINNCKSINGYGGGIYINTTKAIFNDININNCTASKGGGGIALVSTKNNVGDNTITLNKSSIHFKGNVAHSGSQIYVVGSKLTVNNINMDGTEYITNLKNQPDMFKGNDGGAIYAESSELYLNTCKFDNFGAYNNGGVIYYDSNYESSQNYLLDIKSCEFNGTGDIESKRGGAIYIINNGSVTKTETINISDTSINNYSATIGGGLYINNEAGRNIVLDITSSNIYNNSAKGNMINNLDKSSYEIYDDPQKLEGFGGGIFMNNVKDITLKNVKAYNNSCIMNYPSNDYFNNTYNTSGYTDGVSEYKSDINAVYIPEQTNLIKWSEHFIPCGGGIFMMKGIGIDKIKSTNSSIVYNTPDDIFPSYIKYVEQSMEGTISKADLYKGLGYINNDDAYINNKSHIWSLITGASGGQTDYVDTKSSIKSYGTGGRGAILEFNTSIDIGQTSNLNFIVGEKRIMNQGDTKGCGGRGAYIFYNEYDKQTISSISESLYFNL